MGGSFMYNDNELLYLFLEHSDEEAYRILIEKYKPLILSKIASFKVEIGKRIVLYY